MLFALAFMEILSQNIFLINGMTLTKFLHRTCVLYQSCMHASVLCILCSSHTFYYLFLDIHLANLTFYCHEKWGVQLKY